MSASSVSVVIPTLNRERVLLDTISALLRLDVPPLEILVVDQTERHEEETRARLSAWEADGSIRWLHREAPSIPRAMNEGLRQARGPIVLFLDDDIVPDPSLVAAHELAHSEPAVAAVTGCVLQPGQVQEPRQAPPSAGSLVTDLEFPFNSTERRFIANVMAGNLSVKRETASSSGGFDENFVAVAYRFETEFCRRLIRNGGRVLFEPRAIIRHLRAPGGGTRTYGSHLTTGARESSVGDYYFAIVEGTGAERWRYIAGRLVKGIGARFYLRRPWWIPVRLAGELRGLLWAARLARHRQVA